MFNQNKHKKWLVIKLLFEDYDPLINEMHFPM